MSRLKSSTFYIQKNLQLLARLTLGLNDIEPIDFRLNDVPPFNHNLAHYFDHTVVQLKSDLRRSSEDFCTTEHLSC